MTSKNISQYIDEVINKIWLKDISEDYKNKFLLMEDSLKNAFYYHLRESLSNRFLLDNNLRIFTEFKHYGKIADLAVVEIDREKAEVAHLENCTNRVLAIVEFKYKSTISDKDFVKDMNKVFEYTQKDKLSSCRYYLAFIQEVFNEDSNDYTWTSLTKERFPKGRVTELTCFLDKPEPKWAIIKW